MGKLSVAYKILVGLVFLMGSISFWPHDVMAAEEGKKIFGHDTIIAIYTDERGSGVPSQNLVASGQSARQLWIEGSRQMVRPDVARDRVGIEKSAKILAARGGTGSPPVIDEFGVDYDGQFDLKTIRILRRAREINPDMRVGVWEMRGPVPPLLAAAYRDCVDLVIMETYETKEDGWLIAMQLRAAQLNGLSDRSIVGLGLGAESGMRHDWTRTKEELDQQIRMIRYMAPASPGVGFFGQKPHYEQGKPGVTITLKQVEEVVSKFSEYPTDGTGLDPELRKVADTFKKHHDKATLVVSAAHLRPNHNPGHSGGDGKWLDYGAMVEPYVWRTPVMNIGTKDAKNVIIQIRGPEGKVFAKGVVDVPAMSLVVAAMPGIVSGEWTTENDRLGGVFHGWGPGSWRFDLDAPGCNVLQYNIDRFKKEGESNPDGVESSDSGPGAGERVVSQPRHRTSPFHKLFPHQTR